MTDPFQSADAENTDELLSRQGFIKRGFFTALSELSEVVPFFNPAEQLNAKTSLRPPGALVGHAFLESCEPFCHECRNSCPREAILTDDWGYPYLQVESSPCVMCVDVPCTQACPTEALEKLTDPRNIRLGTAIIELTVCTAFQGSGCKTCYDVCPLPDEAIELVEGLPQINAEHCTGCGVCVYECPMPEAVSVYPMAG